MMNAMSAVQSIEKLNDSARWKAVLGHDRGADGLFVYAVRSTGVYCRPSCPSRRPRRDRVAFFESPGDARSAGFRPCRRCRPDDSAAPDPWIEKIRRACVYLSNVDGHPSLTTLAARLGGSPYHLQRNFKRLVGVTPREYADACRLRTVKLYDAEAAARRLLPLVGSDTAVIPLQNGVDATDIVARAVGREHAAGGTVYVAAVIDEPGVIRHSALDHLIFGELDGTRTPRLERLLQACRPAGFQATLSDNVQVDIWTKFVRLSVFSGMTAVTRCPIGPIVADPELFDMAKAAAREAMAVARATGVSVPDAVIDDVDRAYRALPGHMKSSMLEDLERGRPLELPWLSGAVVRLGRGAGVDTPIHRFITAVLSPHVHGAARERANAAAQVSG